MQLFMAFSDKTDTSVTPYSGTETPGKVDVSIGFVSKTLFYIFQIGFLGTEVQE